MAAYTNVDACEKNYDDTYKLDTLGLKNLAKVCKIRYSSCTY